MGQYWVQFNNGEGVPKDDKKAVKWLRFAGDQGHAAAQHNLGVMFMSGVNVPQDNVLAYMWLNIAGANGHDVEEFRGILTKEMSQADIAKAQEKTTQYIKDYPDVY